MKVLLDHPRYSNSAQIELTRESIELEERLRPVTEELNNKRLRVSYETWRKNLESAEECAHFLVDFCRHLANDDSFRPNSSKDCSVVLYEEPGHKTDRDTLSELANNGSALAGAIIDCRSAISRLSQVQAWKPYALAGYVQTSWDSLGCPHGRYTSENPCLTNRIDPIRETVKVDEGYTFLSMDLSQAEYVTWASLSEDQVLATLFLQGKDFHVATAESIRKLVPNWNLREQSPRDAGKTINFAILYQMQPHTLARKLGCSVEVATKIINAYYQRAARAKKYIDNRLAEAEALGYIETFFGRRRYCPEYQAKTTDREAHEIEKTLWNHANAGTSAEIVKQKQIAVWETLRHLGFTSDQVRLSLQMFDQLVWHVRNDVLEEVADIALGVWNEPVENFLPFNSAVKYGSTWGEVQR